MLAVLLAGVTLASAVTGAESAAGKLVFQLRMDVFAAGRSGPKAAGLGGPTGRVGPAGGGWG